MLLGVAIGTILMTDFVAAQPAPLTLGQAVQQSVEKYPAVRAALTELGGKISEAEMRRLNALADVEHKDITEIARDWLAERVP